MRLLICGGREFIDVEYAVPRFQLLHLKTPVSTVISGMAKGGDSIGLAWAKEVGIPIDEYHADWKKHGKAAGPIRNQKMLDEGRPDLVIGLPGGTGTAHMLEISRKAGVKVIAYRRNYFVKEDPVWCFLSNFYEHEIVDDDGVIYGSTEHYYQAAKTLDPVWRQKIISAPTAREAKKLGGAKTLPLREDWNTYKLVAMMEALRFKFPDGRHHLSDQLLFSGDDYLVEYAPWGDTYWGVDKNKKGQNWLGRLLMRRRDELMRGRLFG